MNIESLVVGPLQSNCYIVWDENTNDAMIVDPGDFPANILNFVQSRKLKVNSIICTHGHFDHIGGVAEVKKTLGARVLIHKADLELYTDSVDHAIIWGLSVPHPPAPDGFVEEGDKLSVGALHFTVWSTPGHSPGCICLYGEGILITGDTVFAGSVGRTDLPGGSVEALKKSFSRIIALPPGTIIYPGHGPATTVRDELEYNFFVYEL